MVDSQHKSTTNGQAESQSPDSIGWVEQIIADVTSESDFEDIGFSFDVQTATKPRQPSKVSWPAQSKSRSRVVRINSKPTVGGPLPTMVSMCATYRLPSYYYSLPKYEWKHFFFLQPTKSCLKSATHPQGKPSNVRKQVRTLRQYDSSSSELLRLHSLETPPLSLSKPFVSPTWLAITSTQFPKDPPLPRLMFTRSPTKLLMPLATTSPKRLSPTEALMSREESQASSRQNACKLQPPKQATTKARKPRKIGDPMKVSIVVFTYLGILFT